MSKTWPGTWSEDSLAAGDRISQPEVLAVRGRLAGGAALAAKVGHYVAPPAVSTSQP